MKERTKNIRRCCTCRKLKPKEELIKITTEHSTKEIRINPDENFFGRSAYICANEACIKEGLKKNYISKSLKITSKTEKTVLSEKMNTVLNNILVLQHK